MNIVLFRNFARGGCSVGLVGAVSVLFLLSGTVKLRLIFWAWVFSSPVFHCGYHEDGPISQSRQRFDEFASYTSTQT